jgi:hypothetical protein
MKITRIKYSQAGNALVVAMVLCGVIGLVLATYMELVQGRTRIRARSLAWNTAIPVLEGGIEEAFTHLNDDTNLLTANNWAAVLTNSAIVYQKTRTNDDGTYYFVTLSNALTLSPVIYSKGFVPAPLGQGYISRTVQVILQNSVAFGKAVQARGFVDLSGQSIVDSYDSSNTNYSTGGLYDPAKHKANGDVVSNSRNNPAVNAGNGHIYGTVDTGPGGTVAYNSGGTVGDTNWTAGIEPGWTNNDANVSYADQNPPTGYQTWLPVQTAILGGLLTATNTYVLNSLNYSSLGGFTLAPSETMLIQGNCTWYVGGNFAIKGTLYIAPGAKLSIYVDGPTTTMSSGGIINEGGTAASFSYHGTTNNTTIKYSGSADFIGTINAPEADFTLSGGASLYGAAIVNTYTSKSSGAGLHYDESLGAPGMLKMISYLEL